MCSRLVRRRRTRRNDTSASLIGGTGLIPCPMLVKSRDDAGSEGRARSYSAALNRGALPISPRACRMTR